MADNNRGGQGYQYQMRQGVPNQPAVAQHVVVPGSGVPVRLNNPQTVSRPSAIVLPQQIAYVQGYPSYTQPPPLMPIVRVQKQATVVHPQNAARFNTQQFQQRPQGNLMGSVRHVLGPAPSSNASQVKYVQQTAKDPSSLYGSQPNADAQSKYLAAARDMQRFSSSQLPLQSISEFSTRQTIVQSTAGWNSTSVIQRPPQLAGFSGAHQSHTNTWPNQYAAQYNQTQTRAETNHNMMTQRVTPQSNTQDTASKNYSPLSGYAQNTASHSPDFVRNASPSSVGSDLVEQLMLNVKRAQSDSQMHKGPVTVTGLSSRRSPNILHTSTTPPAVTTVTTSVAMTPADSKPVAQTTQFQTVYTLTKQTFAIGSAGSVQHVQSENVANTLQPEGLQQIQRAIHEQTTTEVLATSSIQTHRNSPASGIPIATTASLQPNHVNVANSTSLKSLPSSVASNPTPSQMDASVLQLDSPRQTPPLMPEICNLPASAVVADPLHVQAGSMCQQPFLAAPIEIKPLSTDPCDHICPSSQEAVSVKPESAPCVHSRSEISIKQEILSPTSKSISSEPCEVPTQPPSVAQPQVPPVELSCPHHPAPSLCSTESATTTQQPVEVKEETTEPCVHSNQPCISAPPGNAPPTVTVKEEPGEPMFIKQEILSPCNLCGHKNMEKGAVQPENEDVKPEKEDAKPGKEDAKPGKEDAKPGKEDAKPGKEDAKPGKEDVLPENEDDSHALSALEPESEFMETEQPPPGVYVDVALDPAFVHPPSDRLETSRGRGTGKGRSRGRGKGRGSRKNPSSERESAERDVVQEWAGPGRGRGRGRGRGGRGRGRGGKYHQAALRQEEQNQDVAPPRRKTSHLRGRRDKTSSRKEHTEYSIASYIREPLRSELAMKKAVVKLHHVKSTSNMLNKNLFSAKSTSSPKTKKRKRIDYSDDESVTGNDVASESITGNDIASEPEKSEVEKQTASYEISPSEGLRSRARKVPRISYKEDSDDMNSSDDEWVPQSASPSKAQSESDDSTKSDDELINTTVSRKVGQVSPIAASGSTKEPVLPVRQSSEDTEDEEMPKLEKEMPMPQKPVVPAQQRPQTDVTNPPIVTEKLLPNVNSTSISDCQLKHESSEDVKCLPILSKRFSMSACVTQQCFVCPFTHWQLNSLKRHILRNHREDVLNTSIDTEALLLFCRHCDFVAPDEIILWRHFLCYHGIKDAMCGYKCIIEQQVPSAKRCYYRCCECDSYCQTRGEIERHCVKSHGRYLMLFVCSSCDTFTSYSASSLVDHVKSQGHANLNCSVTLLDESASESAVFGKGKRDGGGKKVDNPSLPPMKVEIKRSTDVQVKFQGGRQESSSSPVGKKKNEEAKQSSVPEDASVHQDPTPSTSGTVKSAKKIPEMFTRTGRPLRKTQIPVPSNPVSSPPAPSKPAPSKPTPSKPAPNKPASSNPASSNQAPSPAPLKWPDRRPFHGKVRGEPSEGDLILDNAVQKLTSDKVHAFMTLKEPGKDTTYMCILCPKAFSSLELAEEHFKEEGKEYEYALAKENDLPCYIFCSYCDFITTDTFAVAIHFMVFHKIRSMMGHYGIRVGGVNKVTKKKTGDVYLCLHCNLNLPHRPAMVLHSIQYHGEACLNYHCPLCLDFSARSMKDLAKHTRNAHSVLHRRLPRTCRVSFKGSKEKLEVREEDNLNPLRDREIRIFNNFGQLVKLTPTTDLDEAPSPVDGEDTPPDLPQDSPDPPHPSSKPAARPSAAKKNDNKGIQRASESSPAATESRETDQQPLKTEPVDVPVPPPSRRPVDLDSDSDVEILSDSRRPPGGAAGPVILVEDEDSVDSQSRPPRVQIVREYALPLTPPKPESLLMEVTDD